MSGLNVDDPVTFAKVIESSRVIPGDTLYLRAGTYTGDWDINVGGTVGLPITIKPYNNEHVIIDGSLNILKSYVEIYDIDFTDSRTDRSSNGTSVGVYCEKPGFGLYGCVISDMHSSGVGWFGSGIGNVCENVILNNGYREPDLTGVAHGIYTHNNGGGTRNISRNVFFDQFGKYCLQIYSGGNNYLKDYVVEDNIFCGDAVHTGGGLGLIDFAYRRNIQFWDYCQQGRYAYDHGTNTNGEISDNIFFELISYSVNQDCSFDWINLIESGNIVYGGEPSNRVGYDVQTQPDVWTQVIQYSKSERWAGALAVFNKNSLPSISINLVGVPFGNYRLRNGQNPDETLSITWDGNDVNVPTNWTSRQRIGDNKQDSSWPRFGGLVLEKT